MSGAEGMAETKDLGIKLFGRKIPLPACQIPAPNSNLGPQLPYKSEVSDACNRADLDGNPVHDSDELNKSYCLSDGTHEIRSSVKIDDPPVQRKSEGETVQNSTADQEKVIKKPDEILQCPRCNSLETKFCYFNNYNVNQPRHFCRNCQRYWTAGGTIRNVPIGAGRRKNKHLGSQYHRMIVSSDGILTTRLETRGSDIHHAVSGLEPSASFRSSSANESGVEPSMCVSSLTTAGAQGNDLPVSVMQGEKVVSNEPKSSGSPHCYTPLPWVLSWNRCYNGVASMATIPSDGAGNSKSSYPSSIRWYPTPMVAVPGIYPSSMPVQFLPEPYWGSMPIWVAGTGKISTGSNGYLSPSSSTSNSCCSGNGSPALGKRSRDTNSAEKMSEKCVPVPKTLKNDDSSLALKNPV